MIPKQDFDELPSKARADGTLPRLTVRPAGLRTRRSGHRVAFEPSSDRLLTDSGAAACPHMSRVLRSIPRGPDARLGSYELERLDDVLLLVPVSLDGVG